MDDSGSSETNVFLHIGSDSISFHCDICLSWSLTPVLFMVLLHIVSYRRSKVMEGVRFSGFNILYLVPVASSHSDLQITLGWLKGV